MEPDSAINQQWEESVNQAKPFEISKWEVWEAYRKVRANQGAAGVDDQSIADAQMVVKSRLEPRIDPLFHPSSFGYRPGRSALDAVGQARQHCWKYDWVLDLDIKGLFDNIDHDLLMRAVKKHAKEPWVILYIERWLKAPVEEEDGRRTERVKGTPQGGVISPLLANLYLHYGLDEWMRRNYPQTPLERYADDAIAHCRTETEAQQRKEALEARMRDGRLELHADKTKIVYCKDDERRRTYLHEKFDFLGYTFRPRRLKNWKGQYFVNFSPAVSDKAVRKIRAEIRSWKLHLRSDKDLDDLSRMFNAVVRGWIQYYGRFYRSALYPAMKQLDRTLARWASRKYKRLRRHMRRAAQWIAQISRRDPKLWAHWHMGERRGSVMGAV